MMSSPTAFEPVNVTNATSGCSTSAGPISSPTPGRNASAPGGRPASNRISTSRDAMPGVCSAGLNTTVLPVTSAAVTMPVGIASGKFHGAMTTPTPRGWYRYVVRLAGRLEQRCARAELDRAPAVVLAEVDRLAHVGVGFGERLAGFEHAQRRELVAAPAHQVGGAEQHRGALAPRGRAPLRTGVRRSPRSQRSTCSTPADALRHTVTSGRPGSTDTIDARVSMAAPSMSNGTGNPSSRSTRSTASPSRLRISSRRSSAGGSLTNRPGSSGSVGGRRSPALDAPRAAGSRRGDERVDLPALGVAMAHERLVRRVLEQAAHEVRHARHQLADRHVDARADAEVPHGARAAARPCRGAPAPRPRRPAALPRAPRTTPTRCCARCGSRTRAARRRRWRRASTRRPRTTRRSRPCSATPATSSPARAP